MENKKPLPIGKSFFDQVIENGAYYVDKTLFVKDLLDKSAAVTLCTRPRRFGKTLNQTMLKCFFEDMAQVGSESEQNGQHIRPQPRRQDRRGMSPLRVAAAEGS